MFGMSRLFLVVLVVVGWCCVVGSFGVMSAGAVPIKLSQVVDGWLEFDTCDLTREELEDLATKLGRGYPNERENTIKIRWSIRNGDFYQSSVPATPVGGVPRPSPGTVQFVGVHDAVDGIADQVDFAHQQLLGGQDGLGLLVTAEGEKFDQRAAQRHGVLDEKITGARGDITGRVDVLQTQLEQLLRQTRKPVSRVIGTDQEGNRFVEDNPLKTQLNDPEWVVVDSRDGSLLILDAYNHRVLRVSGDGRRVTRVIGTDQEGSRFVEDNPLETQLNVPGWVVVDSRDGSLLITDQWNHRVLRVSGDGQRVTRVIGTDQQGSRLVEDSPSQTQLWGPWYVVVDSRDGSLLVTDRFNHRVLRVSGDGQRVTRVIGYDQPDRVVEPDKLVEDSPSQTRLNSPGLVVVDSRDGSLLIPDQLNNRVLRVSGDGRRVTRVIGTDQLGRRLVENNPLETQLHGSGWVVVDSRDGSLLITDQLNHRVLRVSGDL